MKILLVINDAPYGNEKAYNALRLAMTLQKEHSEVELKVFLMADAVFCALPNQNTPDGYYNIERMLKSILNKHAIVKGCGTCAKARGIFDLDWIAGIERSNMSEYTNWVLECDKVINF